MTWHKVDLDQAEADARAGYTWDAATKDLAFTTSLTLIEATTITHRLRGSDLHPYDAFPSLSALFDAGRSLPQRAESLGEIVDLIAEAVKARAKR